jgi:hypothetical protein
VRSFEALKFLRQQGFKIPAATGLQDSCGNRASNISRASKAASPPGAKRWIPRCRGIERSGGHPACRRGRASSRPEGTLETAATHENSDRSVLRAVLSAGLEPPARRQPGWLTLHDRRLHDGLRIKRCSEETPAGGVRCLNDDVIGHRLAPRESLPIIQVRRGFHAIAQSQHASE